MSGARVFALRSISWPSRSAGEAVCTCTRFAPTPTSFWRDTDGSDRTPAALDGLLRRRTQDRKSLELMRAGSVDAYLTLRCRGSEIVGADLARAERAVVKRSRSDVLPKRRVNCFALCRAQKLVDEQCGTFTFLGTYRESFDLGANRDYERRHSSDRTVLNEGTGN
jgi:hypothetical protein